MAERRRGRHLFGVQDAGERFLLCQAIVPLAVFTAVACTRWVLPHWTLVGFLALFPLLGRVWEQRWLIHPSGFARGMVTLAVVPLALAPLTTDEKAE